MRQPARREGRTGSPTGSWPLLAAFGAVAVFIYLAENIGTRPPTAREARREQIT